MDTTSFVSQLSRGGFGYYWNKEPSGRNWTTWWQGVPPEIVDEGANIYFGINPAKARRGRTERARNEDIAQVNVIYSEFDAKQFGESMEATLAHIRGLTLQPNVIICSGGGYHVYWSLAEPFLIRSDKDRRRIADLQARWVDYVGGDPDAKDLARVLRVPGTYNYKYDPPREVFILQMDDEKFYLEDLTELLPKVQPPSAGGGIAQLGPKVKTSSKAESAANWVTKALSRRDCSQDETGLWLGVQLRDDHFTQGEVEDCVWDFLRSVPQLRADQPWTFRDAQRLARSAFSRPAREPAKNRAPSPESIQNLKTTRSLLNAINNSNKTELEKNGNGHKPQPVAPVATLEAPEEPPLPENWLPAPPRQIPAGGQPAQAEPFESETDDLPALTYLEYDQVRLALDLQEMGDAELLADLYKDQVVYDHAEKSWYSWQGNYWKVDATRMVYRMVSRRVAPQYFHAAGLAQAKDNREDAKNLASRAAALRNKKRLDNVLFLAGGHEHLALVGDEWDTNYMLLGCANGVIDLKTGDFRPGAPRDFIRNISQVEWHGLDLSLCPTWMRFINEIFGDDHQLVGFVRRLLGYSISGMTNEQIFPVFWGEGSNGKTTLMEIIGEVLGDELSTSSQADALMEASRGGGGDSPKPFVYALRGKRLAWAMESNEGRRINNGLIKQLTGTDKVTVRTLHSKPVTFKPTHQLYLITNHRPHISADDPAMWRRVLLVGFKQRFTDNPQAGERKKDIFLMEKLRAELPGILAWLVMGCLEWQEMGLQPPQSVMADTAEYREDEDTIALFVGEKLVTGPNKSIRSSELYGVYSEWCKDFGFDKMSLTAFCNRMKTRYKWEHRETGNYFFGIDLEKVIPF